MLPFAINEELFKQDDLLTVKKIHHAMIEITTKCNLRCSYCLVSDPKWVGDTIDNILVDRILNELILRSPVVIHLHGHGETTIIDGWQKYAQKLIDHNINTSLCSNLNKQFENEEIDMLSKLTHLAVSIDTLDPTLFKQLRRGGDIKQVVFNLLKILSAARRYNRPLKVSFSIVVCDVNLVGLIDLIHFGINLGIKGFTFCNLGVHDTPQGAIKVRHIAELSASECSKALTIFDEIKSLCLLHNVTCDLKYGIIDSLNHKISGGKSRYSLETV